MYIKRTYNTSDDLYLGENDSRDTRTICCLGVLNETLPILLDLYKSNEIDKRTTSIFSIYNTVTEISSILDGEYIKFHQQGHPTEEDKQKFGIVIKDKLNGIWNELHSPRETKNDKLNYDPIWAPSKLSEYDFKPRDITECKIIMCVLNYFTTFTSNDEIKKNAVKDFVSDKKVPKRILDKFEKTKSEKLEYYKGNPLGGECNLPILRDPFIPHYENIEDELNEFDEIGRGYKEKIGKGEIQDKVKSAKCQANQIAILLLELSKGITKGDNPNKNAIAELGAWITGFDEGSIKNALKDSVINLPVERSKELTEYCKKVFGDKFCQSFEKYKNHQTRRKSTSKKKK